MVNVGVRRKTMNSSEMPSILVIGIDPGKTSGFTIWDNGEFSAYQLNFIDTCKNLEYLLDTPNAAIVSIERFTFQASSSRMTRQYDALELIGVARYLTLKYRKQFRIHGTSDASRVGSPHVLKRLGWWSPGMEHANKAAAQIAITLSNLFPQKFETMLNTDSM